MVGTDAAVRGKPRGGLRKGAFFPRTLAFVLMLTTLLFCPASPASAQELALTNLVLNNYEGKIRVRFGVEASTFQKIEAVLDGGGALVLRCTAGLYEKRRYLWNRKIDAASCESRISLGQDGLYHVTVPEGNAPISGKSLPDILRQAWSRIRIDLGEWSRLTRGGAYIIDMGLTLEPEGTSSVLDKTLSIFQGGVLPSVSYQLDFTY